MTIQKSVSSIIVFALVGLLFGLLVIYPLSMVIVWMEFAAERPEVPPLSQFMGVRFWFGFIPKLTHLELFTAFAFVGGLVGMCFGVFARNYQRLGQELEFLEHERKISIPEMIKAGESARLEFKSSVRWDVNEKRVNKALEKVIAKTLAGFMNADGGNLMIGVADDGEVLGLENDYNSLKHKNADGFERLLTDLVKKMIGGDLCPLLHYTFATVDGRDICMVSAEPAKRPVYVSEGNNAVFYVRSGNSTRQMDVREALNYAATRWGR